MAKQDIIKIKVSLPNNENEVIFIKHDLNSPSFLIFQDLIFAHYPQTRNMKTKLYWIDNENDNVYIYTDDDFKIYAEICKSGTLYFHIAKDNIEENRPTVNFIPTTEHFPTTSSVNKPSTSATQFPQNSNKCHHEGIICDGCEGPIYGYRYQCIQCVDYDLCMNCEYNSKHGEHVMFRIPEPKEKFRLNRRFTKKCRSAYRNDQKQSNDSHHRSHGKKHANIMGDIIAGIAAGLSGDSCPQAGNQSSSEPTTNTDTTNKAEEAKFYTQKAESYARTSRDFLTQFAQHFSLILDPFAATDIDVEMTAETNRTGEVPSGNATPTTNNEKATDKSGNQQQEQQQQQKQNQTTPAKEFTNSGLLSNAASEIDDEVMDTTTVTSIDTPAGNDNEFADKSPIGTVAREPSPNHDWTLVNNDGQEIGELHNLVAVPIIADVATNAAATTSAATTSAMATATTSVIAAETITAAFGAKPRTTTSGSYNTTDMPSCEIDYLKLSRDLENHIKITENPKKIPVQSVHYEVAVPVFHSNKKINDALIQMMSMGFQNESGWLIHLLESTNGDITRAIDLMQPHT